MILAIDVNLQTYRSYINQEAEQLFTNKWGDFYYGHDYMADNDSKSARHWIALLNYYQPDLQERVKRAVSQWNLIVRDHLHNETALRLTVGSETTQIPIRVADGLPVPLVGVLEIYSPLAELLLNEKAFTDVSSGLKIAGNKFVELHTFSSCNFSKLELQNVQVWFDDILHRLNSFQIKEEFRNLNQDILGAYFFKAPRVEIYWAAIGIYAQLYNISVEGLCLVTLAHELTHAYTHLGKDIDGTTWDTNDFADTDLPIVEGLAQFYAKTVCEKLAARFPSALEAYRALLETQSPAYTEHENWIKNHPHLKEAVRFCMIQCRSQGVKYHEEFQEILHQVSAHPFSSNHK